MNCIGLSLRKYGCVMLTTSEDTRVYNISVLKGYVTLREADFVSQQDVGDKKEEFHPGQLFP